MKITEITTLISYNTSDIQAILKHSDVFNPEWVGSDIYGRDDEIYRIQELWTNNLNGLKSHSIFYSDHGTGKSYLTKIIQREFYKQKKPVFYIDCTQSPHKMIENLCNCFKIAQTYDKLQQLFTIRVHSVIILDNIDALHSLSQLFNGFLEPLLHHPFFNFVFITINIKRILKKLAKYRNLIPNLEKIHFHTYSDADLLSILYQRIENNFTIEVISQESISYFISQITNRVQGNCRLLFQSFIECVYAAIASPEKKVTIDIIDKAISNHKTCVFNQQSLSLSDPYDNLLLMLLSSLQGNKIRERDLCAALFQIIEKRTMKAKSQSWFYKKMLDLQSCNIIDIKREKTNATRGTENFIYLLFEKEDLVEYLKSKSKE